MDGSASPASQIADGISMYAPSDNQRSPATFDHENSGEAPRISPPQGLGRRVLGRWYLVVRPWCHSVFLRLLVGGVADSCGSAGTLDRLPAACCSAAAAGA